ncbi:glycosyl hydrolase family 18 protein [Chitinophaga sp. Ak27]|uniref:glycosyl hydrolase family 18 protein n=1 Tax=Chitinophaga sp. Ak27 TaxID=2726116 RepID=UPI00145CB946|nr:glycosyl hydrolase family 18 protein [Chitinophaga sp. Ak27]NLU90465.1 hypothetical protein [Chitinophaga sp. Ak27]
MKKIFFFFPVLVVLLSSSCAKYLQEIHPCPPSDTTFRIVGYYSFNDATNAANILSVPFAKLTHINLSFVNPDNLGNFNQNFGALVPFISAAHSHGVKVLYSIGGGTYQKQYHDLLKNDRRSSFIKTLVSRVVESNADGVDVDLEVGFIWTNSDLPNLDTNYTSFVIELAQALRSANKLITSALPGSLSPNVVTQKVLEQFDFINIMSYDHGGVTTPNPINHSTYASAVKDLNNFRNNFKIPANKLVLGVPFYGYGWKTGAPTISIKYRDIVSSNPGAEFADQWTLSDGYTVYYNGIQTIKDKTNLAKDQASGIMIWHLSFDATEAPKSLLNTIYEASGSTNKAQEKD